jgi:hypothetical protein
MREPRRLKTLWAFMTCYRDSFTFTLLLTHADINNTEQPRSSSHTSLFLSTADRPLTHFFAHYDMLITVILITYLPTTVIVLHPQELVWATGEAMVVLGQDGRLDRRTDRRMKRE